MGRIYEFTEEQLNEIFVMYKENFEASQTIAKKFNVDTSVIIKRLKDYNIKIPKGSPYNKQYWVERGMSENDAVKHIKTLRPVNKEYWIKLGYSEEEAILQVEGQKLVSLRGCIAKYGDVEGRKIWDSRKDKRSEDAKLGSANIQYWLNKGYNESEAKIKLSERQRTFSKEKCIEKYGEIEGLKKFTERQNKWFKSLSSGGNLKMGYSKISQDLFYRILETYDIKDKDKIFFATHNKEYRIERPEGGIWLYDFTDIKNKKIIEFHGDMFHGNPKKYKSTDYPHPFKKSITAQEIWEKDMKKKESANNEGFDVMVIWDSEYRWGNKERIINKCVNFLKK